MVKASKGLLSRHTKSLRGKGKNITVSKLVKTFEIGNSVIIKPTSYQRGMPAIRYKNKIGEIVEKRGNSYVVEIVDGNKTKRLISHPVHLAAQ